MTQNIIKKGGGRSAYRAPTAGMVAEGNVAQSHKSRLTPGGKAVRSWKAVDRGEITHKGGVHYKQAHNEESNENRPNHVNTQADCTHIWDAY